MSKQFFDLKKNLKKQFDSHRRVKLAILADSSTQFLTTALRGHGYDVGLDIEIYEADYNQIDSQVLNLSSELYQCNADFVLLFQSTQKLLKAFYREPLSSRADFHKRQADLIKNRVEVLHKGSPSAKIICFNFPELDDAVFGNFANKTPDSFIYQLRNLNCELMDIASKQSHVFICDLQSIQSRVGQASMFDARMYLDADMVLSLDSLPMVAKSFCDMILASTGASLRKCLILDLDNTVWGGIIGDDGIEGVQIGELGLGKAFSDLQLWAKELGRRGILLAICSKNDEQIAKNAFENHPDMVLSLDDIAIFKANWESKVGNIKQIKEFLNIGYDSMVFVDDNPFERNVVREHLPQVVVPELPEDPANYLVYLRGLNLFESGSAITEEDRVRGMQFQQEAKRQELAQTFTNENEFLKSLGMECEIAPANDFSIPRVAQLIQRSNQYNLRTMRYSESDIVRMVNSPEHLVLTLNLKDKYGDHGLISVIILNRLGNTFFIDTWVMSCRVLRRGVEALALNKIVELAQRSRLESIAGEYISTPKNALVKDHFLKLGFADSGHGKWTYRLDMEAYIPKEHFINEVRGNT